ncbi:MAG: L-seryl-tRNA(Sec) selenium transferase [Anaerolineae bacterium]|nr:L-seryl-tRNA(Sec) selenium transferase [Anaerolineae bacterium]
MSKIKSPISNQRPDTRRSLPGIDRLLSQPSGASLIEIYGRALVVEALRSTLDAARECIARGEDIDLTDNALFEQTQTMLDAWLAPTLQRVINATGVIIHTNLGRSPLSEAAIEAVDEAARGYSTLEFDLATGKRGSRTLHAEAILCRLTGAEAALVVNNNAAAVLLALTALAGPTRDAPQGRGAIISRGQLVEIGGGFRVPDVMAQSGAQLVEVGTTNRTHLCDYEAAIDVGTALILRAHRSNFTQIGFTTEPTIAELAEIARRHNLPLLDDLGSGALLDTAQFGLTPEPTVQDSLQAGVDLAMFSGDKLLGGPQAGIMVGRSAVIDKLRRHPLARAIRADKLCLAALAATLTHYLKGEALTCIPVWQMISAPLDAIGARAEHWADVLTQVGLDCRIIDGQSTIGGGSMPGEMLPTALLALRVASADAASIRLRACRPPVIARIEANRLIIDPRTVLERDEADLLASLRGLGQ